MQQLPPGAKFTASITEHCSSEQRRSVRSAEERIPHWGSRRVDAALLKWHFEKRARLNTSWWEMQLEHATAAREQQPAQRSPDND